MPEADDGEYSASGTLPVVALGDPSYSGVANDLVNASLNGTPGGSSVVDPDSVLGDSGRLYHGYKDGKYFFPNDAVRSHDLMTQWNYRLIENHRLSKTVWTFSTTC